MFSAAFQAWDTYQYLRGNIDGKEYLLRTAINAATAVIGPAARLAVKAISATARIAAPAVRAVATVARPLASSIAARVASTAGSGAVRNLIYREGYYGLVRIFRAPGERALRVWLGTKNYRVYLKFGQFPTVMAAEPRRLLTLDILLGRTALNVFHIGYASSRFAQGWHVGLLAAGNFRTWIHFYSGHIAVFVPRFTSLGLRVQEVSYPTLLEIGAIGYNLAYHLFAETAQPGVTSLPDTGGQTGPGGVAETGTCSVGPTGNTSGPPSMAEAPASEVPSMWNGQSGG